MGIDAGWLISDDKDMKTMNNRMMILRLGMVLLLLQTLLSCDPNPIYKERIVPGDSVVNLSIETVKDFYKGADVQMDQHDHFKAIHIYGSLIADPQAGNLPADYLVIQSGAAGLALEVKDLPADAQLAPDEVLQVNIQGGTLKKVNGNLVMTGLSYADVTQTGEVSSVEPRSVTLEALANHFDAYSGTLIKVDLVDIVPAPGPGATYAGAKQISDGTTAAGDITLYTFPDSKLAQKEIGRNATYTAIAMYQQDEEGGLQKQIWLRNADDIDSTATIAFQSPIVITGFLANPTGYDQDVAGTEKAYLPSPIAGGFEYIQFIATEDIDFAKTPYSVVTMISFPGRPGATARGWTAGGFITMKLNLTSGVAKKGTFFYVGSGSKLIDGYSPDGFSTDISQANWIKTVPLWPGNYDEVVGDPFADGTISHGVRSWIDNRTDAGSDAIAVFRGTTVSKDSVPVEAVFLNEQIGGSLDLANHYGFTVPDNDHYHPVNPENGQQQPLFGQGTNTWAVPLRIVNGDGLWVALGGILSSSGFIVERQASGIQLYVAPGKSQLSEIEHGPGVTVWRN